MEQNFFHLFSCLFLLFLLNPFFVLPHQPADTPEPSALDFLKNLVGTQKGNSGKGLSQLKKYLSYLGYIKTNNTNSLHEFDDSFDDTLELAIRNYQSFYKLKVNGILDSDTVALLTRPRCGVPDFANPHTTQIPNIGSYYAFVPDGSKWPPRKRSLTYSFPPGTRSEVYGAILHATEIWSTFSPFKFRYTRNYDQADIKISFQTRNHGDGFPFDGRGGITAHAFPPTDGRLHFDGDEVFVNGVKPNAFDLQTVGLHELGHVLGLGHSSDTSAAMYAYSDPGIRKVLAQDDIAGIRALYRS
ncbi:Stromelysin 1 [Handroanthus impetiginosus]|uniref:Stromelysin 1 n=1 Tax=Handroanthus impetiginosus TaxID=429701 RepID=A0A2G9H4Y3_9LAMI|nr:Stromelysin 1 [Handroanthus impetiginosus]